MLAALRPGVSWPDMQTLAYSCILGGLKRGGLLEGAVGEMLAADVGALFMPHGARVLCFRKGNGDGGQALCVAAKRRRRRRRRKRLLWQHHAPRSHATPLEPLK